MKKLIMLTCSIMMCSLISYATSDSLEKKEKDTPVESTTVGVDLKNEIDNENITVIVLDEPFTKDGIPQGTLQSFSDISFPKDSKTLKEEGVVYVSFTYTEDGYIDVLSTNSSSENLDNYIIEELQKLRLSYGTVTIGKEYFTKFDFKIL